MALALVTMGLTMALVTAQGPEQSDVAQEMHDWPAEALEYGAAQQSASTGRDLRALGAEATGDVRPPGTFDVVLLAEDFELAGSVQGRWRWDGLWRRVYRLLDYGNTYARTHSPNNAMWYGQEATGTYNTGAKTWGVLSTTQPISIPTSAVSVTLSFWSWEETEHSSGPRCPAPPAPCSWDLRFVFISGTISSTWQLLWYTAVDPSLIIEQQWHQVVVDISAYRGQAVKLEFGFNSLDANHNDYEGWYLDDIAIIAHGVPVPAYDLTDAWVQSFHEETGDATSDPDVHMDRVGAAGVTPWQVTSDGEEQSAVAVAAHPLRDIPVAWNRSYTNTHGARVVDVEYTALSRDGAVRIPLTSITDNSGVTFPSVGDYRPAVAVNPVDGSTVIAWTHCISCPVSYFNRVRNVHYAIRDSSGSVVTGPVALTNNTDRTSDRYPAVETFPNGNVLLAWEHRGYPAGPDDVFFTVLDHSGNVVMPTDNLSDSPEAGSDVGVARLADGNILVMWSEYDACEADDIFYAVVDSSGGVVKGRTALTSYCALGGGWGYYPEALGLANGNSIVAWMEFPADLTVARVSYAVLDASYNLVRPSATLANPYNAVSNGAVSMVADEADAAILTWPDYSHPYLHIYYARLDNQGNILTAPTIYRQTRGGDIRSSRGYGVGGLPPPAQVYLPVVLRSLP